MAHFPLYMDLNGKLVFLVGGDPKKEEILRSFGADVRLLDRLTEENLAENPVLVVLARGDRKEMAELCRRRNIPVNAVDDPENCTFFFPSILRKGDTTIAISSGGKAPAASRALRERLEQSLPEHLEQILDWLGDVTAQLRKEIPDYDTRAALLSKLTHKAFRLGRPLTDSEWE